MSSIRLANLTEINLVREEVKKLTARDCFNQIFTSNEQFLILKEKKIRFLVVDSELTDLIFKSLSRVQTSIYSAGTCFALFNHIKGPCKITLEGLYFLVPYAQKKVVLNPDDGLKFLYGRPICLENHRSRPNINFEEKILIFDYSGQILGIGRVNREFRLIPIIDLGYYLRNKLK